MKRFETDITEFTGDGIDIECREKRKTDHLLLPETLVKVRGLDRSIKIDSVLQVHDGVLYDYRGLLETDKGLQVVYFNHDIVIE